MEVIEQIRRGIIDCNNQSLFFSILIKGLMQELNREIKIRNISVPHIIIGSGDEYMYLENKGYDHSKEPIENTNEDYVYNIIPRCMVNPGGVNLQRDQLTSPYSRGTFEIQTNDNIYNFSAEFRRIPFTLSVDLKYYMDSFTDMLQLIQQILSKLAFIRTFNITYMGQEIKCSYSVPDSFDGEYLIDMDGTTQENKSRIISLNLEISANIPIFDNKTVVSSDIIITNLSRMPYKIDEKTGKGPIIIDGYNIYDKKTKALLIDETKKWDYKTGDGD